MEELRLRNGMVVDVEALSQAGGVPIQLAKKFLLQLDEKTPMRKVSLEEQLDRVNTYEDAKQFMKRLCKQDPRNMVLFDRTVKKMSDISMSDLARATTTDEIKIIWERNIPGGSPDLEFEVLRRLAEFFIIEQ